MRLCLRTLPSVSLIVFFAMTPAYVRAADASPWDQSLSVRSASEESTGKASFNRWKLSVGPVFASQTLDVASSYGMQELNPMLAGSDGRLGVKGAGIKLGTTAGFIGIQYWIVHKYPRSARIFTKLNWSVSIVTTGFAAHNFAIR